MVCMQPEPGETIEQAMDRWRSEGLVEQGDVDAVIEFAEHLRSRKAARATPSDPPVAP